MRPKCKLARFTHPIPCRYLRPTPGSSEPFRLSGKTRSDQGLMCGLGATTYSLSLSRDFGMLPLRCLPELLRDGGFRPSVIYGSDLSFDHMSMFFKPRMDETVEERKLPPNQPRGGWGIADRALLKEAIEKQSLFSQPTYSFVMTLSNHSPYMIPDDMPAELEARLSQINLDGQGGKITGDDLIRMKTLSYTDFAVSEFISKIEAENRKAIVLLSADHNTNERFLWGKDDATATRR